MRVGGAPGAAAATSGSLTSLNPVRLAVILASLPFASLPFAAVCTAADDYAPAGAKDRASLQADASLSHDDNVANLTSPELPPSCAHLKERLPVATAAIA